MIPDSIILAVGVVLLLSCPFGLVWFSKWATRREIERQSAATFERDFIAENADVLEQDTAAIIEEICAILDDGLVHIKRLQAAS